MKSLLNLLVRGLSYLNLDSAPSGLRLGSLGSLGSKLSLDLSLSALNLDYLNLNYLNNLNLNYVNYFGSSSTSTSTNSLVPPSLVTITVTDLDLYNENAFGMLPYNVAQSSPYTFLEFPSDAHHDEEEEEDRDAANAAAAARAIEAYRAKISAMLDALEVDVARLNDTVTVTVTATATSLVFVSESVSELQSVSASESVSELESVSEFESASASASASTPVSESLSNTKHASSYQHPLLFSPTHIHPRLLHLPAYLPPGTPRPHAPFTVAILDLDLSTPRSLNWMRGGTAGSAVYMVMYWHPVRDITRKVESNMGMLRESKLNRALYQKEFYFWIVCIMGGIYVATIGVVIMFVRCKYGYDLKFNLQFERQTRLWKTHLVSLTTHFLTTLQHTLTPTLGLLHRLITPLLTTYNHLTRLQLILHTDSDTSTSDEAILLYIGYIHQSRSGLIQSLWVKKLVICMVPYPWQWILYMEDARRVFCEAMMRGRRGVRMGWDEDEDEENLNDEDEVEVELSSNTVAEDLDAERTLVEVDAEKNSVDAVDESAIDAERARAAAKKAIALKMAVLAWSKTVTLPLAPTPTPTLPRTRSLSEELEEARLVDVDVDGDGHGHDIEGSGETRTDDDKKDSFVSNTPTPSNTPINTPSNNESTDDKPAPVHSLSYSHSLYPHHHHHTINNDNTNSSHEDEAASSPRRGAVPASGSFTLTLTLSGGDSTTTSGERGISGNDGTMGGAIVGLVGLDDTSTTVADGYDCVGICSATEKSDGSGIGLVKPEEDQIEDEATLSFAEDSITLVVEDDEDVNATNPDEQKILLDVVTSTSTITSDDKEQKIRSTRCARSDAKARGLQVILYDRGIESAIWYPNVDAHTNTSTYTTRPSNSKDAAIENTRAREDLRVISYDRLGCVKNMTSYTTTLNLMNGAIENIRTPTRTWRDSDLDLQLIPYDKNIENAIWHPNQTNDTHTHTRTTHATLPTTPRTTIPTTPMHEPIPNSRTEPLDLSLGFDLFGFPSRSSSAYVLPICVPVPSLASASALTHTNTNTNTDTTNNTITSTSAPVHEEETRDDNNDVYSKNDTYAETRMVLYRPTYELASSSPSPSPLAPPLGTPPLPLPLPLSTPTKVTPTPTPTPTPSPINHTSTNLHANTQDETYDNARPPSVHVQPDEPKAHTSPLAAPILRFVALPVSESSVSPESKSEEAKILLLVETDSESVPLEHVDVGVDEYVDVVEDADTESNVIVCHETESGASSSGDVCVASELEILISERDLSHDVSHSSTDMTMMNTSAYHDASLEIRGDGEDDGDADVNFHDDDVEGLKSGAISEAGVDESKSTSSVCLTLETQTKKEKEITISTPESACTLLELELELGSDLDSDSNSRTDLAFSSECKIIVRLPATSANTTKASRGATTHAATDVGSSEGCQIPSENTKAKASAVLVEACTVNGTKVEVVVGDTSSKEVDTIAKASTISRTPISPKPTVTLPKERTTTSSLSPTPLIETSPKVVTADQSAPTTLLPSKASVTSTTSESVSSPTLLCSIPLLTKCDTLTPPNLLEKECTLFGTEKTGTVDCVDTSVVAMPLFTCDVTKAEDLVSDSRDLDEAVNELELAREQDSIYYTRFGSSQTRQTSTTASSFPSDPSEPTPPTPLFFEDYTGSFSPTPSSSTNPTHHNTPPTPTNSIYSPSALTAAGLVQSPDGTYLVPTTSRSDGSHRLERKIRPGFLPLDLESRLKYPTGRRLSPNRDVLLRHLQVNNDSDVGIWTDSSLRSRRSASPKERTKEVVGSGESVVINVVQVPEVPLVVPQPSGKSVKEDPDEAFFRSLGGTSASMWAPWNLASNPYAEEYVGNKASISPPSASQPAPHLQANETATTITSQQLATASEDKSKNNVSSVDTAVKQPDSQPLTTKPRSKPSDFESDEAYFRSLGGTSASMWAPWNLASNPYAEEYAGNKGSTSTPSASPSVQRPQANITATASASASRQSAVVTEDKIKEAASSEPSKKNVAQSEPRPLPDKPRDKSVDSDPDEAFFRSLGGTSASMWAPWNLASNPYAEEYAGKKGSISSSGASPSVQCPQATISATEDKIKGSVTASSASSSAQRLKASEIANASVSHQPSMATEDKAVNTVSDESLAKKVVHPESRPQPAKPHATDHESDEAYFRSLGGTSASMWAPWNLASNPYAEEYTGNKESKRPASTSPPTQPFQANKTETTTVLHRSAEAPADKVKSTIPSKSSVEKVVHPELRPPLSKPCGKSTDYESDEAYFRSLGGTSASMWAPWNLSSNPYAEEYTGDKRPSSASPSAHLPACKTKTAPALHRPAEASVDKSKNVVSSVSTVKEVTHPEPRSLPAKPRPKPMDYESDEAYFRSLGGTSASMWAPWNLSSNPYAEEYTGDKESTRQPSPSAAHLRAKETVISYQPAVITESKTMNTVSSETSAKKVAHPEPRPLPDKPRPKPMDYESDEAYFRSLGGTSASMWAPWNLASNPYAEEYTGNKGSISASNASSSSQHCQASETATTSVSCRLAAAAEGETKKTVSWDSSAKNVMQSATSTPLLLKSCSKTVDSDSNNAIFRSLGDASAPTRAPCNHAKLGNNDNGFVYRSIYSSSSTVSTPGHTFDNGSKHRGVMHSMPQTMNTNTQLLPSLKHVRRPAASMRVPSPLSSRPDDKENIPGVSQNPVKSNGVSTRPWRLL